MNIIPLKYSCPYSCYINLTSKCNLRCKHCFGDYGTEEKQELTLKEWKTIIDKLINSKVFFINLSGGEPTQSPYFKQIIYYLAKKGMYFILTTNGVFSKDILKFIIKNQEFLIGVKISLDGPDAKSHGFIRLNSKGKYNPAIFNIVMNNINSLKKKKIPLTIATILHKENIKKINKMFTIIKKIDPISWFISPIVPIGRGYDAQNFSNAYELYNLSFWNNIRERGKSLGIHLNFVDLPVQQKNLGLSAYECAATLNFCEIHSDGTVAPCALSRVCITEDQIKFDNIRDKSLKDIWDGNAFNKFRNFMNQGCNGCKLLSKCNKCIAQSFRYFKRGDCPTPFCIKQGKKMGLNNYNSYKEYLNKNYQCHL